MNRSDGGPSPLEILVVIVNYRCAGLTIDCLRSLAPEVAGVEGVRVVVVENASGEDQAPRIASAIAEGGWSGWASVVSAASNGGFAAGNNVAIAPALASAGPPRYVWLLNPDTVVRPGAMASLRDFLDRRPEVGLAGSRLEDPDGTPQVSAFRFPSALGELEGGLRLGPASRLLSRHTAAYQIPEAETPIDWVAGASLMVRREVFEAIGLLDESYFMYFEEVDFCLRAARAGWPCWYVPASRVVHLVGQSSGIQAGAERARRPAYWFASRRRFFLTHHGRARTLAADLGYAAGLGSFRLRRMIQRKPDGDPRLFLWDFVRYNFLPVKR